MEESEGETLGEVVPVAQLLPEREGEGEEDTEAHALGVLAGEGETDAVPQLEVVKEGLGVEDSESETLGEIVLVAQLLPE